jgi:hypothetical protein
MQKSFFQKIAAMSQQGVTKHYEEFVAEEKTTHRYSENGKFLPLAVWGGSRTELNLIAWPEARTIWAAGSSSD